MFVNHHLHSCYSLLDCPNRVEELVDVLSQRGEKWVNITDHGTLGATYNLWNECNKRDMTPILSCESYIVEAYKANETKEDDYNYGHLILMSMNATGWQNLKKLQALAWKEGFRKKPRVSMEYVRQYNEGLIATTGCISSQPARALLKTDPCTKEMDMEKSRKLAFQRIKDLVGIFGDRLYGEIQLNELNEQLRYNQFILRVCEQLGVRIIVTGDTHYISKDDRHTQDALVCMNWRDQIDLTEDGSGPENHCYTTKELWLKTEEEMFDTKDRHHDYISNDELDAYIKETVSLAERIENFHILPSNKSLPSFVTGGLNPNKYLINQCKLHRDWKKVRTDPVYKKRFWYEWGILLKKEFSDYFLVVNDIVKEARRLKIPYNARGSACGSLIGYLLGITWVDPIRFGTPFERFLTEDRKSLPDIDMDFSRSHRGRMIRYLEDKYGEENVVHIANIVRFQPKGVIKDMSRVFGLNFQFVNGITRQIPDNATWEEVVKNPEISEIFVQNPAMAKICRSLLKVNKHKGVHASGIILTPSKCVDWSPICYATDRDGKRGARTKITEWDMYDLEALNILKLDFLGLNTLDVVGSCIDKITRKYAGQAKFHDLDSLYEYILENSDDPTVYKMIAEGDTIGCFQLGTSDGMIALGKKLKVGSLEDICALIALYRTAVLEAGMHEVYYKRKVRLEDYELAHPKMYEIMDETYGVMVYQEQTMSIAQAIAGFSRAESDHFRKGIKLKDAEKLKPWKDKFVEGCREYSDIDSDDAEQIWKFIEAFAKYGFNKSHSISYALLAYITCFLKGNYPLEYYSALLSNNIDDEEKICRYITDAKRRAIEMFNPLINVSSSVFKEYRDGIMYPISAVKNVGPKAIENILTERRRNKRYDSIKDFYDRVDKTKCNVRVVCNLILAGVFRQFSRSIEDAWATYFELRALDKKVAKDKTIREIYCSKCDYRQPVCLIRDRKTETNESNHTCPVCGSYNIDTDMSKYKDKKFDPDYINKFVFGFNLSYEKLQEYTLQIVEYECEKISDLRDTEDDGSFRVSFVVNNVRTHIDKNGNEMAFIEIADETGSCTLTVFSDAWKKISDRCAKGICAMGSFIKNNGNNLMISSFRAWDFKVLGA